MQIDILTLFPDMFTGFLSESIIKRAIEDNKVKINVINFRDYTSDPHGKVDDTPFGGGAGMVLQIEPIYNALMDIKRDVPLSNAAAEVLAVIAYTHIDHLIPE